MLISNHNHSVCLRSYTPIPAAVASVITVAVLTPEPKVFILEPLEATLLSYQMASTPSSTKCRCIKVLSAGTALVLVPIRAQRHVCHTAGNEVTAEHSIMHSGLSAVAASTDVQVSHHGESITVQNT